MTSGTSANVAPTAEPVKAKKILLAGHADEPQARLVDEAVLELRRRNNRPKFKRAHFIVEAVVEAAREVVGDERADAILKARRAGRGGVRQIGPTCRARQARTGSGKGGGVGSQDVVESHQAGMTEPHKERHGERDQQ